MSSTKAASGGPARRGHPGAQVVLPGQTKAIAKGTPTVAEVLTEFLAKLGVRQTYGLIGGPIVVLAKAFYESSIQFVHCRHEAGATFAAAEASLADGHPRVVLTTTGPGLTNALTGLVAARWEGAWVILISASTMAVQRGKWATQETSLHTLPSALLCEGKLFDYATTLEDPEQLTTIAARLSAGVRRPQGFVAHVSVPMNLQTTPVRGEVMSAEVLAEPAAAAPRSIAAVAELLRDGDFVIWAGFGARNAGSAIRALAERLRVPVMCTARAKGIFPERHPLYLGVTGFGGHIEVEAHLRRHRPRHALVLGTRLGEASSSWSDTYLPKEALIHVDIDPTVFGVAFPQIRTYGIQAEIGTFIEDLGAALPVRTSVVPKVATALARTKPRAPLAAGPVDPRVLLAAIQRQIIDASNAVFLAESGNSFAWATHLLRIEQPGRFRVSTGFGSMGHVTTGVLGAAMAADKAVALVGDGAMLMLDEINTAVQYGVPAAWIVLNDSRYGMPHQGMAMLGWEPFDMEFPRTDFASIARAVGAEGISVYRETEIEAALEAVRAARHPVVVDVHIDADVPAPSSTRTRAIAGQTQQK